MPRSVDILIIGTGTAALSAAAEIRKKTDNFLILSNGVYGTTCIRAGCMPSKVLIQGARLFASAKRMARFGIAGADDLRISIPALLEEVRRMRAHFLESALESTEDFRAHILEGQARMRSAREVEIGGEIIRAKAVVLATGSRPIVPGEWQKYGDLLLTSDTLFEQKDLPKRMAVIGMSVLGAEMAQAFADLGIEVAAVSAHPLLGGLSDPEVSACAEQFLREKMQLVLNARAELQRTDKGLRVTAGGQSFEVDKAFIAVGRCANLDALGLESCGVKGEGEPIKDYHCETMQVKEEPLFIAGDVKLGRAVLHEASDEGRIAGRGALRLAAGETPEHYRRRVPLQICYTHPELCIAGARWDRLDHQAIVVGEASFADQGRAKAMGENHGILRIYAGRKTGQLVGAELCSPAGEHLSHLIACMIDAQMTAAEALRTPFYHPTLEEGLRTALRGVAKQTESYIKGGMELETNP